MHKYSSIKYLGSAETKGIFGEPHDNIVVTEKLDGACFRFAREDNKITFGSRNVNHIEQKTGNKKQFADTIEYLRGKLDPTHLDPDLIYVGEAMKKHTLEYDWEETPPFIGFDILHKDSGLPCDYSLAQAKFDELGLTFVPVLWEGSVHEWLEEDMEDYLEESQYRDGKPEGIVIKNYERLNHFDRPLFAKVKIEEFREKAKAKFGDQKVKRTDTAYIVEQYCTEARIRKIITKMVKDEGRELGRPLMEDLIYRVAEDILDEHIVDIYHTKKVKEIDLGLLNKMVPERCLAVIDEMMEERMEERLTC